MNPLIPALSRVKDPEKMSATAAESSKIDLFDSPKQIRRKISRAYCVEQEMEGNSVLVWAKHLIFPILDLKKQVFPISRSEEYGGDLFFSTYQDLEASFLAGTLHPGDLKTGISDFLVSFLEPFRVYLKEHPEFEKLEKKAYA